MIMRLISKMAKKGGKKIAKKAFLKAERLIISSRFFKWSMTALFGAFSYRVYKGSVNIVNVAVDSAVVAVIITSIIAVMFALFYAFQKLTKK